METNNSNQEQQSGGQSGEVSNEQAIPGNINLNQEDFGNQEDFQDIGSETETGAGGDADLADETDYDDDELTSDEEEDSEIDDDDITADDDDLITDDDDESANDVDGNGGYSDAANPAETNS
jgi:hypothetical protein